MVPRGLRWDILPQQDEVDGEAWYHYFNEAGVNLLCFLMDKKRIRLALIEDKEQRNKKQKKYTRDANDYRSHLVFNWQKKDGDASAGTSSPTEMDTAAASTSSGTVPRTSGTHPSQVTIRKNVHPPTTPNNHTKSSDRNYSSHNSSGYGNQHSNRGRGNTQRGRNNPHGHSRATGQSDTYVYNRPPYAHNRSPQRNHHLRDYSEPYHTYRTPIHTYNRFSPLRSEPHTRDHYQLERSPYTYNQPYPDPPYYEDFPRGPSGPKGRTDGNKAPEEAGGPGKRKRQ